MHAEKVATWHSTYDSVLGYYSTLSGLNAPLEIKEGPQASFSLSGRLRRQTKREKEVLRGHPAPRQRAAALCNPAQKSLS